MPHSISYVAAGINSFVKKSEFYAIYPKIPNLP